MTDSLSIISGKGGSGKTSLAILLSQLLASCGYKVLLVDCDMSTHGATYFFEEKLNEKERYYTVGNIFYENKNLPNLEVLQVIANIDFIPSRIDFSSKKKLGEINTSKFQTFFGEKMEKQNYDMVIFDCQAGYSIETEIVTRISKKSLAVIEADAISASALRILYAQLAGQLDKAKTYQIFNKITKEEHEIYSKLTHGTLFPNLNPIIFDWNLRKAFITNDLPEIDASTPILTTSIYELALALFPQYKDNLREFILNIKQNRSDSLKETLKIIRIRNKRDFLKKILNPLTFLAALITLVFSLFSIYGFSELKFLSFNYIAIPLLCGLCLFLFTISLKKGRDNNDQINMLELNKEQEQLENEIKQIKLKLKQQ